jgi:hypothetical protein
MPQRRDFRTNRPLAPVQERSQDYERDEREDRSGVGVYRDQSPQRHPAETDQDRAGNVEQLVARYPFASLLTGFGCGFGFGLVVTLLLNRREPTWFERYAPESMQNLPDRLKRVPEALTSYIPGSWKHS